MVIESIEKMFDTKSVRSSQMTRLRANGLGGGEGCVGEDGVAVWSWGEVDDGVVVVVVVVVVDVVIVARGKLTIRIVKNQMMS